MIIILLFNRHNPMCLLGWVLGTKMRGDGNNHLCFRGGDLTALNDCQCHCPCWSWVCVLFIKKERRQTKNKQFIDYYYFIINMVIDISGYCLFVLFHRNEACIPKRTVFPWCVCLWRTVPRSHNVFQKNSYLA